MKHEHMTVMFTDIEGFTSRTSKSSRKELTKILELHEELIAPVFMRYGGKVIKTIGDAFLVTFTSPTDAVLCGMEIQNILKGHNKEAPEEEQLHVRIAINSGEVTIKGNDVFGEAVNISSRLEGIAEVGDIYFTESVYLAMNKREIPTAEVGYRHFKGIPEDIKVYKVLREGKVHRKTLRKGTKKGRKIAMIAIIGALLALMIAIGLGMKIYDAMTYDDYDPYYDNYDYGSDTDYDEDYSCYSDNDCYEDEFCYENYCEYYYDYYDCRDNSDCYTGEMCINGYCEWIG